MLCTTPNFTGINNEVQHDGKTQLWDSDVNLNPLRLCLMTMLTMSLSWMWLTSSEHFMLNLFNPYYNLAGTCEQYPSFADLETMHSLNCARSPLTSGD